MSLQLCWCFAGQVLQKAPVILGAQSWGCETPPLMQRPQKYKRMRIRRSLLLPPSPQGGLASQSMLVSLSGFTGTGLILGACLSLSLVVGQE